MALKHILRAMEAEIEAEIQQIKAEAEAEAAAILAEARQEAEAIRQRHRQDVLPALRAEQARLINQAKLAALRARMAAREGFLEEALGLARRKLAGLRERDDYPRLLRASTQEALADLGSQVCLRVDPQDAELMAQIADELHLKAEIEPSLPCLGGLEARTADGRVVACNTIEARLEKAQPLIRQKVLAALED